MPYRAGQFRKKHDNCDCEVPQRIISKERNCEPKPTQGDEQYTYSGALQKQKKMIKSLING